MERLARVRPAVRRLCDASQLHLKRPAADARGIDDVFSALSIKIDCPWALIVNKALSFTRHERYRIAIL